SSHVFLLPELRLPWTRASAAGPSSLTIGEGGFGKVYKAFTDRQQTVAVKIVEPVRCSDPSKLEMAVEQERRGFEILVRIRHRNIVQFLKTERSAENGFCIFTELIAGCSLLDLMNRLNKPFDEPAVRRFSHQALNFLHCEHIVHRDIKCSNIMLTHESVIKLIDFGLAKEIVSAAQGAATYTLGTVHFMAAELLLDDENDRLVYTPKTDVWAFGCTVFEMLERRPPK
uniref:Protein kinase domain-containing protein n=1 Tax=Macrostomum lignano TaxID=282301 RepID=A0A1I8J1N4_9PLAT